MQIKLLIYLFFFCTPSYINMNKLKLLKIIALYYIINTINTVLLSSYKIFKLKLNIIIIIVC